jgi:hypothetical protein
MKLDWRQGILYAAVIVIEGCWLYALMALLNNRAADERLSVFGVLLLYLLSFALNGLLRRLRWPEICRRIISWIAWVAGMLLVVKIQLFGGLAWSDTAWLLAVPRAIAEVIYTFKPELLILISTPIIWWLGRRLALAKISFATLVSEFQFGLLILVITFFSAAQLEVDIAHSVYLIVTFFLFSLLGISVAHALENKSWLSGLYQGHWSGLLLISVSLVLILGFIISLVVTPDLLQLILAALKWIWGLIMKVLAFIASLLPEMEPTELPPPMPTTPQMEPPEETTRWFTMPEALRNGLRFGWTVLVAGFLLFALWRISSDIFRWLRRKLATMAGAEFEPMPGSFRADLLSLLKRFFSKLLALKRLFRPGARTEPVLPEIASVRQIYRQFLRWAAAAGFPRHASHTPHEYLYELAGLLPEAQGDLDLITQQYVRTRYGAYLLNEDELHQLKQSWYNVKQYQLEDRRQV